MKFIFPDSFDLVDPSFDFQTEQRSASRVRHQDDLYAHELFAEPPYDGSLLSMAIVEGTSGSAKYSVAQRQRLHRVGIREFLRLDVPAREHMITMGDCGAFTYVKETVPPVRVDEVVDFYQSLGFDYGMSVDHVILGYRDDFDDALPSVDPVPAKFRTRKAITLDLAADFWRLSQKRSFVPIGVAQGWSPKSYADSFIELQKIGFRYIALGGLVPLKTHEIARVVREVSTIRRPDTAIHLLGVARLDLLKEFGQLGVVSFDTTSPLRQAFKDDQDNYHTPTRAYAAVRVPQVEANLSLCRRIQKGLVDPTHARKLEQACLGALRAYDRGEIPLSETMLILQDYEEVCATNPKWLSLYREVLTDMPWRECHCSICTQLGIEVILFRGAERNRRRGFHNLYVFEKKVRQTEAACVV